METINLDFLCLIDQVTVDKLIRYTGKNDSVIVPSSPRQRSGLIWPSLGLRAKPDTFTGVIMERT